MTALSRRTLLATAAAGLAASVLPARAATAPTSFKHGAFDVIVVSDGHLELPVSFLAGEAPALAEKRPSDLRGIEAWTPVEKPEAS